MQRQLADIVKALGKAQARLDTLADNIPDAAWEERTETGHWSVAECIAHLNLTTEAYIPRIRAAIDEATAMSENQVTVWGEGQLQSVFRIRHSSSSRAASP